MSYKLIMNKCDHNMHHSVNGTIHSMTSSLPLFPYFINIFFFSGKVLHTFRLNSRNIFEQIIFLINSSGK